MADLDACIKMRAELVKLALQWQEHFGVAPRITDAISEFDAALCIVKCDPAEHMEQMRYRTAVSRGHDFIFDGNRFQVKANRPSGAPGCFVTKVGKANNYDWEYLIWILYSREYIMQEAWLWTVEAYRQNFEGQKRISPNDMRRGEQVFPVVYK